MISKPKTSKEKLKMAMTESLQNCKGINYDYIQALLLIDGTLVVNTFPIHHNMHLIDTLSEYLNDGSKTVEDMVILFKKNISNVGDFWYCLCNSYRETYISDEPRKIPPIPFPKLNEYVIQWKDFYSKQEKYCTEAVLKKNRGIFSSDVKKKITTLLVEKTYKRNHELKGAFMNKCIPYIFALDHDKVKKKVAKDKDVLCHSNEDYCRKLYKHKINDDITIIIDTNFCFGSSSFFRLIVNYKGINLLPYSFWVKYYYARIEELLFCTRNYYPDRDNWEECLEFVKSYVNKAIKMPNLFIKEEVVSEVEKLIEGIDELRDSKDSYIIEKIMVAPPKEGDPKYIGIRVASQRDSELYAAYPHEFPLVYRMEKIAGALRFIKSLNSLLEIEPKIKKAIRHIKKVNKDVYPDILKAIPPMRIEIRSIENAIKQLDKLLMPRQKKFDRLDAILETRKKKGFKTDLSIEEIKEVFDKRYPEYEKLKIEISDLEKEITMLEDQLSHRRRFLEKMEKSREMIEEYVLDV